MHKAHSFTIPSTTKVDNTGSENSLHPEHFCSYDKSILDHITKSHIRNSPVRLQYVEVKVWWSQASVHSTLHTVLQQPEQITKLFTLSLPNLPSLSKVRSIFGSLETKRIIKKPQNLLEAPSNFKVVYFRSLRSLRTISLHLQKQAYYLCYYFKSW